MASAVRRWGLRVAVLASLVAAVWLLRVTVFAPAPTPVRVAEVRRDRVEQTVTNSRAGTVKARHRADLSPEIGGRVVALPHRKGDRVETGEVVLQLDASLQEARLDLANRERDAAAAQRVQACLSADRAARERERTRRLADQRIVSVDVLDQFESAARIAAAACDAAGATEERARAAVELARRELDKTVLRAPFAGIVAELSIEVGEWTTPSPPALPVPPVLDILDPSSIYVSAPMDEVDSARIHPGQTCRLTVDSYPGQHFPGRLVRVAPYVVDVEAQNRTVEIEAELDDARFASTLLPGTSADVEVILEARDHVLRVPTGALLPGGKVLLVDGQRLVERTVDLGLRNWDATEVRAGLAEHDRVVVSLDRPEIRAGARVAVEQDGAP